MDHGCRVLGSKFVKKKGQIEQDLHQLNKTFQNSAPALKAHNLRSYSYAQT